MRRSRSASLYTACKPHSPSKCSSGSPRRARAAAPPRPSCGAGPKFPSGSRALGPPATERAGRPGGAQWGPISRSPFRRPGRPLPRTSQGRGRRSARRRPASNQAPRRRGRGPHQQRAGHPPRAPSRCEQAGFGRGVEQRGGEVAIVLDLAQHAQDGFSLPATAPKVNGGAGRQASPPGHCSRKPPEGSPLRRRREEQRDRSRRRHRATPTPLPAQVNYDKIRAALQTSARRWER